MKHRRLSQRGGRASRRKGGAEERALVRYLQGRGLNAEKISRTGYTGSDLTVDLLGVSRSIECKVRARAFGQLYKWLGNSDLLVIRQDRKPALIICPLWLGAEIARVAEGHQAISEASKGRRAAGPFVSHAIVGEA